MNNQAAQTMPTVPQAFFDEFGVNADDRVMDYGRACYEAGLNAGRHPDALPDGTMSKSTAKRVEALAASGGEDKGDPVCHEDDGCPTEGAVLKRFWRSINTHDTKQLMAFYGVDDVASLIWQQVEHVQSLQAKLYAPRTPAGNARLPKSPREG